MTTVDLAQTEAREASPDLCLALLRSMWVIRLFEAEVQEMFSRGLVRGSTHLCSGQEAVSVGVCSVLTTGDTMTCTYRGHGALLASDSPIDASFAEILGRAGGLCGGKGGSMHLTDVRVGALGSFAIVGANLPITVGAALAAQYLGSSAVSVAFFGDGATNIGAFHESLNLASIWRLPAVFVCENNLYGEYSPVQATTPVSRLSDRASAYGMPGVQVDGNDVLAVREAVSAAVVRARAGEGPTLLEALTYRHFGHSRSDPAKYRPPGELEEWLQLDPIPRFEAQLLEKGLTAESLAAVRSGAETEIKTALERALSWPSPGLDAGTEHVWAMRT